MAADERLEICESRDRLWSSALRPAVVFVAGVLVLGLCAWLWSRSAIPVKHFEIFMIGGAALASASGAALSCSAISMMRRLSGASSPGVFVTEDGFKDVRISPQLIPWSAILKLRGLSLGGGGFFVVVDPGLAATMALTLESRMQRAANLPFGHRGLWVTAATLETHIASALFEEISGRLYRATGRLATNENVVSWSFKLLVGVLLVMLVLEALISWLS